jgi:phosphoglycerate dehydrogenase-like enzyme
MNKTSLDKGKVKILLLEGVRPSAVEAFRCDGYTASQEHPKSLADVRLAASLHEAYTIEIRSATQVTARLFEHAPGLIGIGCFCIGANQVDLVADRHTSVRKLEVFCSEPHLAHRGTEYARIRWGLLPALKSCHLAGAVMDVFPIEPKTVGDEFPSPLRGSAINYAVIDVETGQRDASLNVKQKLEEVPGTIRTRILH